MRRLMAGALHTSDFDFELPPERIAQEPLPERTASRLLVLARDGDAPPTHHGFAEIAALLPPRALLVLNETRVIPARFLGRRAATGGKVELLLIEPAAGGELGAEWEALVKAGGSLGPGEALELEGGAARVSLVARTGPGRWRVRFAGEDALAAAERCGRMPLPPYVRREADARDRVTYQTVFARVPGAIAAPTAGLHFTPELLAECEARGVELARVVLHVGLGTFLPVKVERIDEHVMHAERYEVPPAARERLARARAEGRPIVCCGTTALRALEAYGLSGEPAGETTIFITPGHAFRWVDGLITNFHLPRSTLLMLVSALAGRERVLAAYAEAIAAGYRFYSYGDAMLIRPGELTSKR